MAFVADENMLDRMIKAGKSIVEGKGGVATQAEDVPDAMEFEQAHQRFGAVGFVA